MDKIASRATIISYNIDGETVCASGARISTTRGDAIEIFENAKTRGNNPELIQKVVKSGHKSVIEHAVFTIAFCNVSAFAEQFFIEFRLASFTVKSRRYVDFGKLGYYTPPDLAGDDLPAYRKYMDSLFGAYQSLLEQGAPKEDARFLLPYAFNSNFYMTINARELAHIVLAINYGRGANVPELRNLAGQIVEQIKELFPSLLPDFEQNPAAHNHNGSALCAHGAQGAHYAHDASDTPDAHDTYDTLDPHGAHGMHDTYNAHYAHDASDTPDAHDTYNALDPHGAHGMHDTYNALDPHGAPGAQSHVTFLRSDEIGGVELVDSPKDPLALLNMAHHIANPTPATAKAQPIDINSISHAVRPRELEQLSYTFLISNISLSGLTHIVRHRMQSIVIPPIQSIDYNKFILPDTVIGNPRLRSQYEQAITEANGAVKQLKIDAAPDKYNNDAALDMYNNDAAPGKYNTNSALGRYNTNSALGKYIYYFALSGNVMDIMTTMNGRELLLFMQLRTCNRAQWEIRNVATKMLALLRGRFPALFNNYGPSCYTNGYCPEGKLSCGKMGEVIAKYKC